MLLLLLLLLFGRMMLQVGKSAPKWAHVDTHSQIWLGDMLGVCVPPSRWLRPCMQPYFLTWRPTARFLRVVAVWFVSRCTCLDWKPVSVHLPQVKQAAEHLVAKVNNMSSSHAGLCARLTLNDVMSASRYVTGDQLLEFRQSSDIHGRIADFSDSMKSNVVRLFFRRLHLLRKIRVAKYCDEPVCVSVHIPISQEQHVRTSPNFVTYCLRQLAASRYVMYFLFVNHAIFFGGRGAIASLCGLCGLLERLLTTQKVVSLNFSRSSSRWQPCASCLHACASVTVS